MIIENYFFLPNSLLIDILTLPVALYRDLSLSLSVAAVDIHHPTFRISLDIPR